ncbi:hypothetical protein SAMN05444398_10745 [Roseovarius pacificus]|uniref:Uncharacterized protein n=1 Tax=Roseovarius pacificus TaxID=337701 RepID=A0A1M7EF27_9RHOB|nr:hypothetical protein [Roseovarius pacificus]GGO57931.1 hypothetical protein GCM10011315_26300 [Roseovarius pacificus]SHL90344.1 hypothetical protein SAMN05444398_10745 [Roseovarius pacificus]
MQSFDEFDWSDGTPEEHLKMVREANEDQLRHLARSYDWAMYPVPVLGWAMAQKCMDLGTALTVFLNGEPERFNYVPKRHVPEDYRGVARMLDNICLRVNSGFYLVYPERDVSNRKRLMKWVSYQQADRAEGRQGRYTFDEEILQILLNDALRLDPSTETAVYSQKPSLLRDLFSPVMDLGVSRRLLRFKPPE